MRVVYNDYDDRTGLRGYVKFNKYTRARARGRGGHVDARLHRRQATWWKVRRKDRAHTSKVTYPSNMYASCRPV